ncbi:nuclear-pore anchor-like protein, partial [Trifolium medium]|nr:nuclear-pore anchor-like protein [Trifolium medium]
MAGSQVHTHVPSILPLAAPVTSSLPPKATGDSEKRPAPTKSSIETRKSGRRLVRPRLVKPDEPQGDTEMSDAE